jgi:hypothetical protein
MASEFLLRRHDLRADIVERRQQFGFLGLHLG